MSSSPFARLWSVLPLGLWAFALAACSGAAPGGGGTVVPPSGDGWTGQTNIEAIFEASCSGCHGTQWSTCWDVQENAAGVDDMVSSGAMPRSGSLSAADKSTLLAWLGRGAPCTGTKPDGGGDDGGDLPPVVVAGSWSP
jgi:hypothetical protein